eukprot:154723-Pyramimonas_sp.AAC.1
MVNMRQSILPGRLPDGDGQWSICGSQYFQADFLMATVNGQQPTVKTWCEPRVDMVKGRSLQSLLVAPPSSRHCRRPRLFGMCVR